MGEGRQSNSNECLINFTIQEKVHTNTRVITRLQEMPSQHTRESLGKRVYLSGEMFYNTATGVYDVPGVLALLEVVPGHS